jgi:hypothetical protein
VVYSVESNLQLVARRDLFADNRDNQSGGQAIPFWQVCELLADSRQPFDVLFFPDGELRQDHLQPEQVSQYRTLILPDCRYLTPSQSQLLRAFLERGGHVLALGGLGDNLPESEQQALLNHPNLTRLPTGSFQMEQLPGGPQLQLQPAASLAVNIQRVAQGAAIHIIRYDYDPLQDCLVPLPELTIDLRMDGAFTRAEAFSPNGQPQATLAADGSGSLRLSLRDVPLYTIVLLHDRSE